jgi:hypothetical protein
MESDNGGSYKCKCGESFESAEKRQQHIDQTSDATDWKTHGVED